MSNPPQSDPLLHDLLGPLHMHFLCARAAYADYLAAGKTFLFARSLRRINGTARELLIQKGFLLPDELQQHAVALVRHYDVWLTLWDDLAARSKPQQDDVFVFENSINYPKEAEARLGELYRLLAGQTPAAHLG